MKANERYGDLVRRAIQAPLGLRAEVRQSALKRLYAEDFPSYKSEDYQRTDPSIFLDGFDDVHTATYTISSDAAEENTKIFAGSLVDFFASFPHLASKYYGRIAESDACSFVHLCTAATADGYVLYVPRGYRSPSVQRLSFEPCKESGIDLRRILILMEEDSEASVIIGDSGVKTGNLSLQICEIFAAANSRLSICETEISSANGKRFSSTHIEQCTDSYVAYTGLTLSNGTTRNNYYARLRDSGAEIKLTGLSIGVNGRHIDNFSRVEHMAPHCQTEELFKYIVGDEALGVFSGRIYVDQEAQKTVAYQNNRNLILSPTGKMYSKPQLEIYADDVKCSHGMTTGQLDEQALFYLRARGIPAQEARRMLTIAFAEEIVETIFLEGYREEIRAKIANEL